jgi:hypothetical protein
VVLPLRSHLSNTLHCLGYTSYKADPDVWFRAAIKPDGFCYYKYVLVYADDLMVLSHQGEWTRRPLKIFINSTLVFLNPLLLGSRSQAMDILSRCL